MKPFSPKWFLAFYAVLLLCLAALRPMWLDEVLQLSDTYHHSLRQTVERVALNPGGVPFTYVAENLIVNASPHPFYAAHLFSILCAVAGMASLIWLVKLLGDSALAPMSACIYALIPISLRYAVEARQYGPALALSICATALLVWLDQRPSWWRAVIYAVVLALGLYSQPYVGFIAVAHLLWALRRPSAKHVFAGCLIAGLSFLPWYLYARSFWVQAVKEGGYQSSIDWRTPFMILRELSGGGYLLSIVLVALAVFSYKRANRLLWYCALVPIPLVLAANIWFHYFFAIRQLLFIVPPLCLLAAHSLNALPRPWRIGLATVLALIALVYDFHWFAQSPNFGTTRVSPVLEKDRITLGTMQVELH